VRFEGYYADHELPIKKGQMVTIKKGTIVKVVGKDPKPSWLWRPWRGSPSSVTSPCADLPHPFTSVVATD